MPVDRTPPDFEGDGPEVGPDPGEPNLGMPGTPRLCIPSGGSPNDQRFADGPGEPGPDGDPGYDPREQAPTVSMWEVKMRTPREPDGSGQPIIDTPPGDDPFDKGKYSRSQHAKVLNRANDIFIERNEKRKDAFLDAGAIGNMVELRKKIDRLWAAWDNPNEKDIDEALDLINTAVFYIRCAEMGNVMGTWDWPSASR